MEFKTKAENVKALKGQLQCVLAMWYLTPTFLFLIQVFNKCKMCIQSTWFVTYFFYFWSELETNVIFLSPNELRSDKMHAISRKTSNIFMSERNLSNLNSCFCISRQVKNGVAFWWSRSWTITLKNRILQKPIHSLIGIYGRFVCLA